MDIEELRTFIELKNNLLKTMLSVVDLSEKFQYMGTKEIDNLLNSTINSTSKRTNPIIKKLYELEITIGNLNGELKKAILRAKIIKETDCEDPKSIPSSTTIIEPDIISKTDCNDEKTVSKPIGRPKKTRDDIKTDEQNAETAKVDETKVDAKTSTRTKKIKEQDPPDEEQKHDAKPTGRTKKIKDDLDVKNDEKKNETKPVLKEKKPREDLQKEKKPESSSPVIMEDDFDEEAEETEEAKPLHIRRKNIPKHVKTLVWNLHMGVDKLESKCLSCRQEKVDARNFDCGHVIAEAKGGSMNISNLRPICRACNSSMGTKSMNEFTKEFFGWEV